MSLCVICSEQLYRDADILCKKHKDEFDSMKDRIEAGESPPFGLDRLAWNERVFADISRTIKRGSIESLGIKPEETEQKINEIVDEANREVRMRAKVRSDPNRTAKINEFAKTLGIIL